MVEGGNPWNGILTGFSCAALSKDGRPTNLPMDFTRKPFLAIERLSLQPPPHMYRHDLESFFWVLWWIVVHFKGGKDNGTTYLNNWHDGPWETVQLAKRGFLAKAAHAHPVTETFAKPPITRSALPEKISPRDFAPSPIHSCLDQMGQAIRLGYHALKWIPEADYETAGGHITFDIFKGIIEDAMGQIDRTLPEDLPQCVLRSRPPAWALTYKCWISDVCEGRDVKMNPRRGVQICTLRILRARQPLPLPFQSLLSHSRDLLLSDMDSHPRVPKISHARQPPPLSSQGLALSYSREVVPGNV